jgi:hypothetical protein
MFYKKTFVLLAILLILYQPGGYSAAGESSDEESSGRWIQVNNSPIVGEGGETKIEPPWSNHGSFTIWSATETSLSHHSRQFDNNMRDDLTNVKYKFTLPQFPRELSPGQSMTLTASGVAAGYMLSGYAVCALEFRTEGITMEGELSDGTKTPLPGWRGPHMSVDVIDDPEAPWTLLVPKSDTLKLTFEVPEGRDGAEISITAFLWNGIETYVTWVYRYEEKAKEVEECTPDTARTEFLLDVYLTQPNSTKIKVNGTGLDPINITMLNTPPPYLEINVDQMIPVERDGSYREMEVNVSFDITKAPGLALPAQETIFFATKSGEVKVECFKITLDLLPAEWLVMHYLSADTHPDIQRGMVGYFEGICGVSRRYGNPKVGIIALVDLKRSHELDPDLFGIARIPGNNAQLYRIVDGKLIRVGGGWGSTNMSSRITLKRFLDESTNLIPAPRTHLILSGHGMGIEGFAVDSSHGNSIMTVPELGRGLAGHLMDVISFDSCFMGQVEVLYELKYRARYITASERPTTSATIIGSTVLPGGLAYDDFLKTLCVDPQIDVLDYVKEIVDSYGRRYGSGGLRAIDGTYSAVDCSRLDDLADALDDLAFDIEHRFGAGSELFNRTLSEVVERSCEAHNDFPFTDIRDFANKIATSNQGVLRGLKAAAESIVRAHDAAVVANVQTRSDATADSNPSCYNGLTVTIWRKGLASKSRDLYNMYLWAFKETQFYRKAPHWYWFNFHYTRSMPTMPASNGLWFLLTHPEKELYLHVYDSEGRHIGYNPGSPVTTKIDSDIPGSMYHDFRNGTDIIFVPPEITEFEIVVDGGSMEEPEESYELAYEVVSNNQVTYSETLTSEIRVGTNHSTPVEIQGDVIVVGETVVEGDPEYDGEGEDSDLPNWFRENFRFLLPFVDPLVPLIPAGLLPFFPFFVLGLPILVVLLAGRLIMKRRKKEGQVQRSEVS